MRHSAMVAVLILAASVTPVAVRAQASPEEIVVRLTSFAYDPDPLLLRVGVPVRLRFVNDSSGGHDFVARAFFAASEFAPGVVPPADGKVELAVGTTATLTLVPRVPGTYTVRCTHFLHALFGMTGTIVVSGPS